MKHFLLPITITIISAFAGLHTFAQDTIYDTGKSLDSNIQPTLIRNLEEHFIGCNHSHNCCEIHCSCCGELNRPQYYDTIYYPAEAGVQRITVVERYKYALMNELLPVHFRFRAAGGAWSKKYYCAENVDNVERIYGEGFYNYPAEMEAVYRNTNRMLVVDEAGDFSMIDLQGNEQEIPFLINKPIGNGVFLSCIIVADRRLWGFSDGKGHKTGPLMFSSIGGFDEAGYAAAEYFPLAQGNMFWFLRRYGIVDRSGKLVSTQRFDVLKAVGTNRFVTGKGSGEWGQCSILIDGTGKELTPADYTYFSKYSEGLLFARKTDSTFVYLDMNGEEVISMNGNYGHDFHNGLAAVQQKDRNTDGGQWLWGFIDLTGKLVLDYKFTEVKPFYQGVAPVAVRVAPHEVEWKLVNKKGVSITNKEYFGMDEFKNGLTRAEGVGGMTLLNTKGNELFPSYYVDQGSGTKESWFIHGMMVRSFRYKDSTLEVIDETGKRVLDLKQYIAGNFTRIPEIRDYFIIPMEHEEKYFPYIRAYKKDGIESILDLKGTVLFEGKYKQLQVQSDSICIAWTNTEVQIVNLKKGIIIATYVANQFNGIEDGIIKVQNNKYGYDFFDLDGKRVEEY